jgi:hypothetical protein
MNATDVAFRTAQDESIPTARRIAAATAFEVLTLEVVAAELLVPAEDLKTKRSDLVRKGAATLAIVADLSERDAQRAILDEVRNAETIVAKAKAAEELRSRNAAVVAAGRQVCSRCGGTGTFINGGVCYGCDGSGVRPV